MASLKDLVVLGSSRFIGDVYFNRINSGFLEGGARYIEGTDAAANPDGALLRSGPWRLDSSPTGDTWLFYDTFGGASYPWGIKHDLGGNNICFYGNGSNTSYINLQSGRYYNNGLYHLGYGSSGYVFTTDGGVALIGGMSVNYATSSGNSDTVDNEHANEFVHKKNSDYYYPFVCQSVYSSSGWHEVTFPFSNTTSENNRWFVLSMDVIIGGSYGNGPCARIRLSYYFYSAAGHGIDVADKVYGVVTGNDVGNVLIAYKNGNGGLMYIYTGNYYTTVSIENLTALDSAPSYNFRNTTIAPCSEPSDISYVPLQKINNICGNQLVIGNGIPADGYNVIPFAVVNSGYSSTGWCASIGNSNYGVLLGARGTTSIIGSSNGYNLSLVPDSGLVGIGTTGPNAKLHVEGNQWIGNPSIDNTAFTNTLTLFANLNNESSYEQFNTSASSWGITFKRQWNSGYSNNSSAGIYAVGSSNWRTGLAFRTKNNTSIAGDHDTTSLWLSPSGMVGVLNTNPTSELDVNGVIRGIYTSDPGSGGSITGKLLSYTPSPYGLVFRSYSSGELTIQSLRESNYNETFSLDLNPNGGTVKANGYPVWTSGNDGSGSGLDADTVDGCHSDDFAKRVIHSSMSTDIPTDLTDGIHLVNRPGIEYSTVLAMHDYNSAYFQIYHHPTDGCDENVYFRSNNTGGSWRAFIDSSNWGSYIGTSTNYVGYATNATNADTLDGYHYNGLPYLPITGGTITPGSASNYTEGIRINDATNGWTTIALGGSSTSGTGSSVWSMHTYNSNFYLNKNGSSEQQATRLYGHSNGYTIGNTSTTSYALNVGGYVWSSDGFKKSGSTNGYVLLGDGGHKKVEELEYDNAVMLAGYCTDMGAIRTGFLVAECDSYLVPIYDYGSQGFNTEEVETGSKIYVYLGTTTLYDEVIPNNNCPNGKFYSSYHKVSLTTNGCNYSSYCANGDDIWLKISFSSDESHWSPVGIYGTAYIQSNSNTFNGSDFIRLGSYLYEAGFFMLEEENKMFHFDKGVFMEYAIWKANLSSGGGSSNLDGHVYFLSQNLDYYGNDLSSTKSFGTTFTLTPGLYLVSCQALIATYENEYPTHVHVTITRTDTGADLYIAATSEILPGWVYSDDVGGVSANYSSTCVYVQGFINSSVSRITLSANIEIEKPKTGPINLPYASVISNNVPLSGENYQAMTGVGATHLCLYKIGAYIPT